MLLHKERGEGPSGMRLHGNDLLFSALQSGILELYGNIFPGSSKDGFTLVLQRTNVDGVDELQPLILPLVRPRASQLAIRIDRLAFASCLPLALVRIQVHPSIILVVAVLVELDAVAGG